MGRFPVVCYSFSNLRFFKLIVIRHRVQLDLVHKFEVGNISFFFIKKQLFNQLILEHRRLAPHYQLQSALISEVAWCPSDTQPLLEAKLITQKNTPQKKIAAKYYHRLVIFVVKTFSKIVVCSQTPKLHRCSRVERGLPDAADWALSSQSHSGMLERLG